jgi:hypothetical protein
MRKMKNNNQIHRGIGDVPCSRYRLYSGERKQSANSSPQPFSVHNHMVFAHILPCARGEGDKSNNHLRYHEIETNTSPCPIYFKLNKNGGTNGKVKR